MIKEFGIFKLELITRNRILKTMSRLVGKNDISAPKNIQNKGFTILFTTKI